MNRIFSVLMLLCVCIGSLSADESECRQITIRPFTGALVANASAEETTGTVKFQKCNYWVIPCYQIFLDGAPALKVSLGLNGCRLFVRLPQEEGDIELVEANWHGDRYDGALKPQALADNGISEEQLLRALSFLRSIHYSHSKNTWAHVQKAEVETSQVSLLINTDPSETQEEAAPEVVVEEEQPAPEVVAEEEQPAVEVAAEEVTSEEQSSTEAVTEEPQPSVEEQIQELAQQAEEAHAPVIAEATEPPSAEQEAQAVEEFIQTLPEELQTVAAESSTEAALQTDNVVEAQQ